MRLTLLLFLFTTTWCFSQQRVGFDLSYRQAGLNATVNYHKVFAKNWLISGTVNFGGKGKYSADYRDFSNNISFVSPWNEVNEPIVKNNLNYELKRYDVSNRLVSAQIGLGYFYNVDVTHGIRAHIYGQLGQAFNEIVGYYTSSNKGITLSKKETRHSIAAVSAEFYHTIHLWKKFTLYYGLKTPYYFKVDNNRFNPVRKEDDFFGLEPEVSLGITYLIGDC